jgi:hypothetical protein
MANLFWRARCPCPSRAHVSVTIESGDAEREAFLKLSEDSLTKVWDDDADDIYNNLLKK